jgi:hypothetical protein
MIEIDMIWTEIEIIVSEALDIVGIKTFIEIDNGRNRPQLNRPHTADNSTKPSQRLDREA